MYESIDAVELFIGIANSLRRYHIDLKSPLEEMVLRTSGANLAYVDDRKKAKEQYSFDLWNSIKKQCEDKREDFASWIRTQGIDKKFLYSRSQQFPDFLFKVRRQEGRLTCGSLLELKDTEKAGIASFNSTIPTKHKSLDEVDKINGKTLVSRIASAMDGELGLGSDYRTFQRRSFYLVRSHKKDSYKVRISIVDGSFFETVPKDHLIHQTLLNIFRDHLEKKHVEIPTDVINQIEKFLFYFTDQTIIAASRTIENASVRPRLRIMAEVNTEGNPHGSSYPKILENSFNLILEESTYEEEVGEMIKERLTGVRVFTIQHKRNGKYVVFSLDQT